jgi:hypothetical protein
MDHPATDGRFRLFDETPAKQQIVLARVEEVTPTYLATSTRRMIRRLERVF